LEAGFNAKAEVNNVSLDFANAKMQIQGISVGDAEHPMQNLFELDTLILDTNIVSALAGRVIVDHVQVSGVALATPRQSSAALDKIPAKPSEKPKSKEKAENTEADNKGPGLVDSGMQSINNALPDVNTILKREPLQTQTLAQELDSFVKTGDERWKTLEASLPEADALKQYEKQVNAVLKRKIKTLDDFEKAKKDLKVIKKKLKSDQTAIKSATQFLQENTKALNQKVKALRKAPQQDINKLKEKYKLEESGALNISGLLFGAQVQSISSQGLGYYKRIKPLLASDETEDDIAPERLSGRFIHFAADKPDFWIKRLSANGKYESVKWAMQAQDISHQQDLTQKASVADIELFHEHLFEQAKAKLILDYRDEAQKKEQLNFNIRNYLLSDFNAIKEKDLKVSIADAKVNTQGKIVRFNEKAKGESTSVFTEVQFNNQGSNNFSKELASAIASVDQFTINASFKKRLDKLKISSDLDNKINKAIKAKLKQQQKQLEAKLEKALQDELTKALAKANIKDADAKIAALDGDLKNIDKLLKAEFDDFAKQEKKEQKEKHKKKLKEQEKKLKKKLKDLF